MKARTQPHHKKPSNMRTVEMEIIDGEEAKELFEQLDNILVLVCITSF